VQAGFPSDTPFAERQPSGLAGANGQRRTLSGTAIKILRTIPALLRRNQSTVGAQVCVSMSFSVCHQRERFAKHSAVSFF
jgi:hypothetical protein